MRTEMIQCWNWRYAQLDICGCWWKSVLPNIEAARKKTSLSSIYCWLGVQHNKGGLTVVQYFFSGGAVSFRKRLICLININHPVLVSSTDATKLKTPCTWEDGVMLNAAGTLWQPHQLAGGSWDLIVVATFKPRCRTHGRRTHLSFRFILANLICSA